MAESQSNRGKVIALLNEARASELTAILQYMNDHYELEDQDFGKLALMFKQIAIQEMRHAEAFAERILFLGGTPTSTPDDTVVKGREIADMLEGSRKLETLAIDMYNDHARQCSELNDHISEQLFKTILGQEENHYDQFDNVHGHVEKLGAAYLATLAGGEAEAGAGAQEGGGL